MPVFKQQIAFEMARNIKVFLHLAAGVTRGRVPNFKQQTSNVVQDRTKQKNQQLKHVRERLADRNQEIAKFREHIDAMNREKGRHEYKDVWNAVSGTRRHAARSVLGDNPDEESLRANGERTRQILESTVGVKPDDVILETGCGIGRVGGVLAPICKQWISCDMSANMLGHARERLASFDNVKLVEISGFDLSPIEEASVDLVYCTVLFMHLDEWDRYNYVLEAHRVLRPGGRIYVDNFNLRSEEGWEVFEDARRIAPSDRPPHIGKSSTPQDLEVYLRRGGFQEVQTREDGLWAQAYGVKPTDDARV